VFGSEFEEIASQSIAKISSGFDNLDPGNARPRDSPLFLREAPPGGVLYRLQQSYLVKRERHKAIEIRNRATGNGRTPYRRRPARTAV
jgi:hypothetical protein